MIAGTPKDAAAAAVGWSSVLLLVTRPVCRRGDARTSPRRARGDVTSAHTTSLGAWIDAHVRGTTAREAILAAVRLATYCHDPDLLSVHSGGFVTVDGRPFAAVLLEVAGASVAAVRIVVNPARLTGVAHDRPPAP